MKKCVVCKETRCIAGSCMCGECADKTCWMTSKVAKLARKFERRRWRNRVYSGTPTSREDALYVLLEAAKGVVAHYTPRGGHPALVALENAVNCAEALLQ